MHGTLRYISRTLKTGERKPWFAFADTLQRVSASALPHNMFGLERETPSSGIDHSSAPLSICFVGLAQKEPAIPSCACGSPFHVTWRAVFR